MPSESGLKQKQKSKSRSPWLWVPSLYYAEGIPYIVVMTVSVIFYKRMGISNSEIALYTSWLYLPWVIKPLWSPFVDIFKMRIWALVRNIFSLLFGPSERVTEYRFVNKNLESGTRRVLDVGGANSNLAISLSKKGLLVDVIDVREYPYKHKNLGVVKGDLIEHVFDNKYDDVILVSTIEHIGLCVYGA